MFKRNDLLTIIMIQFPGSFITSSNELILIQKGNGSFGLDNVTSEIELKCKLLEWVSRDACKTEIFRQKYRNEQRWSEIRDSINGSLDTNFTHDEMCTIYHELGNQINRSLTLKFINSGYSMDAFK